LWGDARLWGLRVKKTGASQINYQTPKNQAQSSKAMNEGHRSSLIPSTDSTDYADEEANKLG
jgi:hypothetical protein